MTLCVKNCFHYLRVNSAGTFIYLTVSRITKVKAVLAVFIEASKGERTNGYCELLKNLDRPSIINLERKYACEIRFKRQNVDERNAVYCAVIVSFEAE